MEYKLRELALTDAEDLAKATNNLNVSRYLKEVFPYPYSVQDAVNYIDFAINSKNELVYGVIIDDKVCGCICTRFRDDVYSKSCGLGYWLSEKYWNKGIMSAVVKDFCSFIFKNYDIVRIDADVFVENVGSRRVLENVGFELEGIHRCKVFKYGKFMDEAVYAIIRN